MLTWLLSQVNLAVRPHAAGSRNLGGSDRLCVISGVGLAASGLWPRRSCWQCPKAPASVACSQGVRPNNALQPTPSAMLSGGSSGVKCRRLARLNFAVGLLGETLHCCKREMIGSNMPLLLPLTRDRLMDRSEFLRIVKQQFPELRELINKEQGLLHFEVSVLRRYTQRAIFDGDRQKLTNCFKIAEQAYVEGNRRLKIAIDTSFVEDLDFVTPHHRYDWAWDMLPEKLKSLYRAFYSDILHRFDTVNDRPL
jgi:hypothetical protein